VAGVYPWIWRHLPGPWPVKSVLCLALLVIVVSALFLYVFPWAEQFFPFLNVTVEEPNSLGSFGRAAGSVLHSVGA
jgi:hypothetical protein